jgi:hypothetical protein
VALVAQLWLEAMPSWSQCRGRLGSKALAWFSVVMGSPRLVTVQREDVLVVATVSEGSASLQVLELGTKAGQAWWSLKGVKRWGLGF